MKFFRLFRHDVISGVIKSKTHLYVLLAFFFLAIQAENYLSHQNIVGTWMDYVFFCYKGIIPFSLDNEKYFRFPIQWLLQFGLCLFVNLQYPLIDISTVGQQIIARAGNRSSWWMSKCAWSLLNTFVFFVEGLVTLMIYCICRGIPVSLHYSPEMLMAESYKFGSLINTTLSALDCVVISIIMPLLLMLTLNVLQLAIGLLSQPILGFFSSLSVLIVSAIWFSPLAIGSYGMIVRSNKVLSDGVDARNGAIINICIIIASIILGHFHFRTYDILPKEGTQWNYN